MSAIILVIIQFVLKNWKLFVSMAVIACVAGTIWFLYHKTEKQKNEIIKLETSVEQHREIYKENEKDIDIVEKSNKNVRKIQRKKDLDLETNRAVIEKISPDLDNSDDDWPVWERINELFDSPAAEKTGDKGKTLPDPGAARLRKNRKR